MENDSGGVETDFYGMEKATPWEPAEGLLKEVSQVECQFGGPGFGGSTRAE